MSFNKDALIHKLQDEIDAFCDDNILVPIIYIQTKEGKLVYDIEQIRNLFEDEINKLKEKRWTEKK